MDSSFAGKRAFAENVVISFVRGNNLWHILGILRVYHGCVKGMKCAFVMVNMLGAYPRFFCTANDNIPRDRA